ncbi:MAG: glycosyltransferase family 2 protein [Candidatus Magasanikbacteria bacterium]|nr:glycosyltransferase family 2 protein [Candidatus Magasanikbacteria bacterium]
MENLDLSIITVGYKSAAYLKDLLESFRVARVGLQTEFFIIDNASGDGSLEMIEREFKDLNDTACTLRLIQNEKNLGFARANNIGIAASRGRYVLLLNPDMRLNVDTLTQMVAWMDKNPQAAVAGCKLQTPDGAIQPHVRAFPKLSDQLAILLKIPHIFPGVLKNYLMNDFNYSADARVDSIRGSFFMIRRETIEKIGGLDERYFIWFEEVDYCRSVAAANLQVWYTSAAICTDFVGRSFSLVSGFQKQKYFTDSMVKYFKKWHTRVWWVIGSARYLALAAAWIAEKISV